MYGICLESYLLSLPVPPVIEGRMEALRGAVNDIADVIGVPAAGVFFLFTLLLSMKLSNLAGIA